MPHVSAHTHQGVTSKPQRCSCPSGLGLAHTEQQPGVAPSAVCIMDGVGAAGGPQGKVTPLTPAYFSRPPPSPSRASSRPFPWQWISNLKREKSFPLVFDRDSPACDFQVMNISSEVTSSDIFVQHGIGLQSQALLEGVCYTYIFLNAY